MMQRHLEICCFNPDSAVIAAQAGAHRIELCSNKNAGGISPPVDWVDFLSRQISIPIHIMIRNRIGNFVYSKEEMDEMLESIRIYKNYPIAGFVWGGITSVGKIDIKAAERIIEACKGYNCTFHKAFDELSDRTNSVGILENLGFNGILTSGGKNSVEEGIEELKEYYSVAKNIQIIPGGSVRSYNISSFKEQLPLTWIHSSGILNDEMADALEIQKMLISIENEEV